MRHSHALTRQSKRKRFLSIEGLEDRLTPAAPFPEFIDPNPNPGNQFGATVMALSTGNVVITSPFDDFAAADAGAVYLFNGATGALISTLRGSTAGDNDLPVRLNDDRAGDVRIVVEVGRDRPAYPE